MWKIKKALAKTPLSSPPVPHKWKFRPEYKSFKISYLEFFFWKYYFGHTTFLHTFHWTSSKFFYFRFSSRKSQSQQKLAKKEHWFYSMVWLKHLTYFYEPQLTSCWKENGPAKLAAVWCQKKHLHCTISWHPRTAFLKANVCIFLYISLISRYKISSGGMGGG